MKFRAVATCGFGLESIVSFELRRLGAEAVKASDGRVTFEGDACIVARANLRLRTAERVLLLISEFDAPDFDALFDGVGSYPWGELIGKDDIFPVKGYCINSQLSSVPACQAVIKKSLVERLKKDHGINFLPERGSVLKQVRFSIVKNRCTVMLDTSGVGLHKRGWRPLTHQAPIRETLAAGIVDLARVGRNSTVYDPFCGSGTLVIEAALRAKGLAAGENRSFAGEQYDFLADGFRTAREEIQQERANFEPCGFLGYGSDIDPKAVESARENAKRAGVADRCIFTVADARELRVPEGAIVLANPPYGERLMSPEEAEKLMGSFGRRMMQSPYGGLYVITADPCLEKEFGQKAMRRRKLYNGMIPCTLYMYYRLNEKK